jgi:hypothetical protein
LSNADSFEHMIGYITLAGRGVPMWPGAITSSRPRAKHALLVVPNSARRRHETFASPI